MTSVAHLKLCSLQVSVFNRLACARASLAGAEGSPFLFPSPQFSEQREQFSSVSNTHSVSLLAMYCLTQILYIKNDTDTSANFSL